MRHASPIRAAIVRERAQPLTEEGRPLAHARGSDWSRSGADGQTTPSAANSAPAASELKRSVPKLAEAAEHARAVAEGVLANAHPVEERQVQIAHRGLRRGAQPSAWPKRSLAAPSQHEG